MHLLHSTFRLAFLWACHLAIFAAAAPGVSDPVYHERPLTAWLDDLSVGRELDPTKQNLALDAVKQIGTNALPTLLQRLQFVDAGDPAATRLKRAQARLGFEALGAQAKPAIPRLINLIRDETFFRGADTALAAAAALRAVGSDAIPALSNSLYRGAPSERYGAALALSYFPASSSLVAPPLIAALKDNDNRVRARAADSLGAIPGQDEKIIPALIATLSDSSSVVRLAAAGSLREAGSAAKSAIPALAGLAARDPEDTVRFSATQSLLAIGPDDAVAALSPHLNRPQTFATAARALARFGVRAEPVIPALVKAFKLYDLESATAAGLALRAIGPKALTALIQNMADPDPQVKYLTVRTISMFGKEASSAIPSLTQAAKSSDEAVRDAAIATLQQLGVAVPNP